MRSVLLLIACLFTASGYAYTSDASDFFNEFDFYTEEYPPYNFSDGEKVKGIAVDLLNESAKLLNTAIPEKSLKLRPWARSYRTVLSRQNTVLFSAARSAHREKLFKWVGPIASTRIVLIARKDAKIVIHDKSEIKNYSIGVITDDIGEQLIKKKEIGADDIEYAHSSVALARMLEHKRIDLWSYEEKVALWAISSAGYSPKDYEVVYVLEPIELYYALNLDTSDEVVSMFQSALDQLKQNNKHSGEISFNSINHKYQSWWSQWDDE
ncbi:ABC transporter substrate-binding protein [Vibrio sp. JC009]|uniref:substrate-binding periplasmic protein n=1 Tax=Vibrio sp. JC009 TaxID=2912314 RepID=UPI0023AF67F0|nr:ABC transporter substrate-binding protein [Vibrio sp. JC009]WED22928.1 ABC transporter substrate-binding protein [Vibrio sp. JC009]